MEIVRWVPLFIFAFFSGWFLVSYLTIHPLKMSRSLLLTILCSVGAVVILITLFQDQYLYITLPLILVAFIAGYSIRTRIFLNTPDCRTCPLLVRQTGDPGGGHTAVIYFTHGEPETYDPIGWINQFREFDEQGISFIPRFVRPIFAYQLRKGYLRIGRSNHVFIHNQMLKSLERECRLDGDETTRFYVSFLDASPTPKAAAIQALNEGANRIIVSTVFLTISNHTAEGENQIRELDIENKFGIPVHFTSPLYDSETLKLMFLERVNANSGGFDKSEVGVLLVGHGQPDEWDKEWPTETEQELSFREGVLDLLAVNGYRYENMSLAWMAFKEPRPAPKIEEFVKNGVKCILYFSAAISADAMHSQYDIPALINRAKIPDDVVMKNMGAWNDDPIVIRAIKEKIDLFLND